MAAPHVVVLLKDILDPELPSSRFRVDREAGRPAEGLGPSILGPFERSALELALKLKDAAGGHVTALSVGDGGASDGLRKAMAVRVDEAVQVSVGRAADLDPWRTADLLLGALERLADVDLVVAGRQAGDWDHGQVGYLVAERLGWPCVGLVRQVWFEGDELRVRHDHAGGQQVVSIQPPAVLTVTNDDALLLRMARVNDLMAAQRRPITRWEAAELGSATGEGPGLEISDLWLPEHESVCEIIQGEDPSDTAMNAVRRLRELKLL
jgi:electron transfer flavoprotein beta subunit